VLFCESGYSESRRRLAPFIPEWQIAVCDKDEVASNLRDVDVVVPYGAAIDEHVISRGTFCLIQQFGVGLETVDVAAASAAGVWVARVPSAQTGNAQSVAEHAILLMLALSRRFAQMQESVQHGVVGEPAGVALAGKTACIIGMGGVGSALAARLQSFGMRLIGVRERPILGAPAGVAMRVFGAKRLHEALSLSDYTIVCVAMNAANRNLIDRGALFSMKKGAILINVARGGLVDTEALREALASGHLGAAGLDVFSQEPIDPADPLFQYDVVITPHVAGVTDLSYDGIARAVAQNLDRYARGQEPLFAVNSPTLKKERPKPALR
jgi:phosphoglycerate dehydrogenase-like enzyme